MASPTHVRPFHLDLSGINGGKSLKKYLIGLVSMLLATSLALAAPESYTLDSRHSFPVFQINHLGLSLQLGRFNRATGKFVIDREAKSGSVDLTIDAASIDMGIEKWDEQMKGEDYFNVEKFPSMTFKANSVFFDGDRVVGAEGDFTLLGVTRPVRVVFAGFNCTAHPINKRQVCGGNASATFKRSDFGLTKGLPGIGDEVRLSMAVEAFRD
jgi:polyisoprenoid-binding protein YceI